MAGTISLAALGTAFTGNVDTLATTGTSSTLPNGFALVETGTNANALYTAGIGSITGGDTSSLSIAAGASFAIRWVDFNATGSDDGLAIDDFSIIARGAAAHPAGTTLSIAAADTVKEGASGATTPFTFAVTSRARPTSPTRSRVERRTRPIPQDAGASRATTGSSAVPATTRSTRRATPRSNPARARTSPSKAGACASPIPARAATAATS